MPYGGTCCSNIGSTLGQCLQRWPSIEPTIVNVSLNTSDLESTAHPIVNIKHVPDVDLKMAHRLRPFANINTALAERVLFAGKRGH